MSLINQMLQDLDKRNAGPAGPVSETIAAQVRPVSRTHVGSDWFWRVLAGVMLIAVCWVAWLMWELAPRSVVTSNVNLQVRAPAAAPVSATVATPGTGSDGAPAPAAQAPVVQAPDQTVKDTEPGKSASRVDMLRLATEITTPIPAVSRNSRVADKEGSVPGRAAKSETGKSAPAQVSAAEKPAFVIVAPGGQAQANPVAPPLKLETSPPQSRVATAAKIDRRDTTSVRDKSEAEFRRAVALVNQGRVSEGMEAFRAALQIDPSHDAARQTMVALQLESKRYDDAIHTLSEGIAASPKNLQFIMLLARVMVERNDLAGALAVLDKHGAGAGSNADFRAFRGALQQRMGRHNEAIDEYRAALVISPGMGQWWIGLGISQQAQAHPKDALESFRRAKGAGNLTPELASFVDQRIRQLQN
jgi:MSHA biogenesis protein MshN